MPLVGAEVYWLCKVDDYTLSPGSATNTAGSSLGNHHCVGRAAVSRPWPCERPSCASGHTQELTLCLRQASGLSTGQPTRPPCPKGAAQPRGCSPPWPPVQGTHGAGSELMPLLRLSCFPQRSTEICALLDVFQGHLLRLGTRVDPLLDVQGSQA